MAVRTFYLFRSFTAAIRVRIPLALPAQPPEKSGGLLYLSGNEFGHLAPTGKPREKPVPERRCLMGNEGERMEEWE